MESSSISGVMSSVTEYGYNLVETFTEIALDLPNIEPDVLMTPIRLRSACSSDRPKSNVEIEEVEPLNSSRNCSKCVEQGKTCIRGCPNADRKRRRDNANKQINNNTQMNQNT